MDEQEFKDTTARVMTDNTPLTVELHIKEAWLIVAVVQLGTRHPGLSKPMKRELKNIARQFEQAITSLHPEAAELLQMGWKREHDRF